MAVRGQAPVPSWLLQAVRASRCRQEDKDAAGNTDLTLARHRLHTVCRSARCPNRVECYAHGCATFLILGETCTRTCAFCAVPHGKPGPVDAGEPRRIRQAVEALGLRHVVVTSVTRDDLPDGGAGQFAAVTAAVRGARQRPTVELLVPDFRGQAASLEAVLGAGPDVLAHNLETVPRLYPLVRAGADYRRSLALLSSAARWGGRVAVKSGIMLGLGETEEEVAAVLGDLRHAGVRAVTIGQYLAPSLAALPVVRYAPPEEYRHWEQVARAMGFASVRSGPLVRSSYQAAQSLAEVRV
jgi:lipoic acid synthetase